MSLATELAEAYAARRLVPTPSSRDPEFGLEAAYAVEAELARGRAAGGHRVVGRKIGFANRALWRVFKLDTVLWAHMYDDTVRFASGGDETLALGRMVAPKIEPEIIFRLKRPPRGNPAAPAGILADVEWMALGFEIVDCVYPDWKFKPADFVAEFGLHAALVVGPPLAVDTDAIASLAQRLATAPVRLERDGTLVAEGSGANVLESPALCLAELAAGIARQPGADPLDAGEIIATGALTDNQFIAPGQSWTASVGGLGLADLTVRTAL